MGYNDSRRFPDFSYISKTNNFNDAIDCVIISHLYTHITLISNNPLINLLSLQPSHLDHCGALPYFTEMCGFNGPVYMTHPTRAIVPILLEDYRKITVERKGETNFFTSDMIKACMKKTIAVNLHQTVKVDDELEIRAYYAGHVIGAAMFYVRVGNASCVYTGDYNMTPDRHLGAAAIDRLRPTLLITESTYATTIRDSKRARERNFLKRVHQAVDRGGKVLIPVFALGRAQELCLLIDSYWQRMNLTVPIYFSAGMTERATEYYKLFIGWTNENVKQTFVERNMFDFKHIRPFDRTMGDQPGPMVLFATPGMLHAGTSLDMFKKWAPHDKNLVVIPGYCVRDTDHQILTNHGFLFLDQVEKLVATDLRVATYDAATQQLRYETPQALVLNEPNGVPLVELGDAASALAWDGATMPVDDDAAAAPPRVSIVVSREHELVLASGKDGAFRKVAAGAVAATLEGDVRFLARAAAGCAGELKPSAVSEFFALCDDERRAEWLRSRACAMSRDAAILIVRELGGASLPSLVRTPSVRLRDELVILCLHAGLTCHFDADGDATMWRVHVSDVGEPLVSRRALVTRSVPHNGRTWCFATRSGYIVTRRALRAPGGDVVCASRATIQGNCAVGTVGNRLMQGMERVQIDARTTLAVRCEVKPLSFSAHADAKGILSLIRRAEPRHVMLVHGEKQKMAYLKNTIMHDLGIPCFDPPNGTAVTLPVDLRVPVDIAVPMLAARREALAAAARAAVAAALAADDGETPTDKRPRRAGADTDEPILSGALLGATASDGSLRLRAVPWPQTNAAADQSVPTTTPDTEQQHTLWLEASVPLSATAMPTLSAVLTAVQAVVPTASIVADAVDAQGVALSIVGAELRLRWRHTNARLGEQLLERVPAQLQIK